ncbi:MAG: phosphonatase-like hydrolase [Chitinophagaceae bacterium]|nr:MAG: phosphonatase-like hydrolase [Chitinophagaceae bacterium]
MIRMVVFDMAGTTVDEDNVVYKTVLSCVNARGYAFTLDDVLEHGAGKEKLQAIKDVLAIAEVEDDQLAKEIFNDFKEKLNIAYREFEVRENKHASELFDKLRKNNILVVLNTGYDRTTAEFLVDKLGWKPGVQIDALVTASDVPRNRPEPDMIWLAMKQFNISDGKQVVKVGDSAIDIEEGKNAGCGLSIGITTGAQTKEQLQKANPDNIIDDLLQLFPIVTAAN